MACPKIYLKTQKEEIDTIVKDTLLYVKTSIQTKKPKKNYIVTFFKNFNDLMGRRFN